MDELTGVVNLYPWFGGARKELFMRLLAHGDDAASGTAFSDAAMYVSSRRLLSKAFRDGRRQTCEDDDIGNLLKRYIAAAPETDSSKVAPAADGNAACASPCLCYPFARRRNRPALRTGTFGTCFSCHHTTLYRSGNISPATGIRRRRSAQRKLNTWSAAALSLKILTVFNQISVSAYRPFFII